MRRPGTFPVAKPTFSLRCVRDHRVLANIEAEDEKQATERARQLIEQRAVPGGQECELVRIVSPSATVPTFFDGFFGISTKC